MTVRDLIETVISTGEGKAKLYDELTKLFSSEIDRDFIVEIYGGVIKDLLSRSRQSPPENIVVCVTKDEFEGRDIYDTFLKNLDPQEVPEDKQPYIGFGEVPEGSFDLFDFAYWGTTEIPYDDWEQFVNLNVEKNEDIEDPLLLAALLWKLTYYGLTETDTGAFFGSIFDEVEEDESGFSED